MNLRLGMAAEHYVTPHGESPLRGTTHRPDASRTVPDERHHGRMCLARLFCTHASDPAAVATSFNECINSRDLPRLTALMTDDHRFVDAASNTVAGKEACADAWRGFFALSPRLPERVQDVHHPR